MPRHLALATIILLAGLPALAQGHGMELMQARMDWQDDGSLRLEITADYGGNPMLNSEAEARDALQDILRIDIDGTEHKLKDLAPLNVERRDQFDRTSPMPPPPETAGTKHELVTALWQWQPTGRRVRFTVPKGSVHDVLFWRHEGAVSPQWRVLITGDSTPTMQVPGGRSSMMGAVAFGVLVLGLFFVRFRRKTSS
ncbi:MAG: hypothetical protein JWO08_29 [Verrucomicrobiaceae bacterium]|nr:hypothetical protein [Verrucomicrobiaceae bacterium]